MIRRKIVPFWIVVISWLLERPWPILGEAQMQHEISILKNVSCLPEAMTPWEKVLRQLAITWCEKRLRLLERALAQHEVYIMFRDGDQRLATALRARLSLSTETEASEWVKKNDPAS